MRLMNITWPQAEEYFKEHETVIIPVGSIECHGKQNPLGTDNLIPEKILDLLEPKTDALIAPILPYGCTDGLSHYPGTVNLGYEVLYEVLTKITESLERFGAKRFVFLNGHGGNNAAMTKVGLDLRDKGHISAQMNWWKMVWQITGDWEGKKPWHGGHGGAEETSCILAIDENLVDKDAISDLHLKGLSDTLENSDYDIRYKGVDIPVPRYNIEYNDNGWIGNDHPKYSNKEWGEEMMEACADYIADFIEEFKKVKL